MTMPSPAPDPAHQPAPGPAFDPGSANERTVTTREFLQIFTAVMLPMLMAIIDQTLLATATPVIAADLGDLFNSSWIATAYLLASATMVPVYGRLGDRYGRRRMLLIAMGVFIAGSLGCAASQSMMQLIASRTVQGLGAGGLMSLSFALIGELVPPRQRVSYQAYFAINSMAGNILGPMIGGLVVAHVSWRWLPAVNIPLGVLATWRLMKLPQGQRHPESPGLSDLPGLGLFAAGTLLVLFALSSAGHRFAWISWQSVTILALGVASWWVLFLHEKRLAAPFFPIELLQMPAVRQWLRTAMLSTFCLLALIFYLPLYFQLGLHVDSATSGMLLTPVLLGFITGGALGGRRAGRTGDPKSIPIAATRWRRSPSWRWPSRRAMWRWWRRWGSLPASASAPPCRWCRWWCRPWRGGRSSALPRRSPCWRARSAPRSAPPWSARSSSACCLTSIWCSWSGAPIPRPCPATK